MIYANTNTIDTIINNASMSMDDDMYMGNLLISAVSNNTNILDIIPHELHKIPRGLPIMGRILSTFDKKDIPYITKLRQQFIACSGK